MTQFELWIHNRRHRFSGPNSWSELSDHQAVALMRLRATATAGQQLVPAGLFPALGVLYGLKRRYQRWLFDEQYLRRAGLDEASIEQTLELGLALVDTLDWVRQDDPTGSFPGQLRRYDFHFGTPVVWLKRWCNRRVYTGPAAALGNCTFEEFIEADRAFRAGNLPGLAAVLCRPIDPATSERIAYDARRTEQRTALFADLDPALLQRIAFGFGSSCLLLQRSFRHVFPKKQTPDEAHSGKTNSSPVTWLDLAIHMAKLDATKVGLIEQLNLYLALKVLDEQMRQAEAMDQQIEKLKAK